ncbi:DUF362 domain-containing protein [Candidatus Thorarchaeota archaeon]|nr:MAG: DUF362 domain-containing protein [Candidatus Thorarchaeota archaeon]
MLSRAEVAIAVKRSPKEALHTALRFLSSPLAIGAEIRHVVVKPSIYDPDLPGNTSLGMMEAVIDFFQGVGKIFVVESDNPLRDANEAFDRCGYGALQEDVELVNLSGSPMRDVLFPGNHFQERKMPEILHRDSLFVNVATLKPEPNISGIGGGIKNLFGLLPERDKSVYHKTIDSVLLDLLVTYRPNLSIVDLTNPVVGKREEGRTKHLGGIVRGVDPVAIDSFCASILGLDPFGVRHIRMAYEEGLGEAMSDRIKVRGTDHQKNVLLGFYR